MQLNPIPRSVHEAPKHRPVQEGPVGQPKRPIARSEKLGNGFREALGEKVAVHRERPRARSQSVRPCSSSLSPRGPGRSEGYATVLRL